jgi:hypothetical protein
MDYHWYAPDELLVKISFVEPFPKLFISEILEGRTDDVFYQA